MEDRRSVGAGNYNFGDGTDQRVQSLMFMMMMMMMMMNWIGHILRGNCLLKHVIEGKIEERIEVTGR